VAQQHHRVGPAPSIVGIRKVLADVAQSGRAQQCVGARMRDHIGITVTLETNDPIEVTTTEHHHPVGIATETVDVESLTDPHFGTGRSATYAPSRPFQILWQGDLAIGDLALDHHHLAAAAFDERRIVGGVTGGSVGSAQRTCSECLRGLHGHQRGAIRSRHDHVVGDHLDRVGHRNGWNCSIGTVLDCPGHTAIQIGARQRACSIVHADDGRVVGNCSQTSAHRIAPCGSARDGAFTLGVVGRDDHDDTVADTSSNRYRPIDHPHIPEEFVLFGGTETAATATAHHDRPNLFGGSHVAAG